MREEVRAALHRYEAMADLLSNIPEKVEQQGVRDRAEFGARYLGPATPIG